MKKIVSITLLLSIILSLFAGCGSSNKIVGRWAADNLYTHKRGVSKKIVFVDMNLYKDGTGDYIEGDHCIDGSDIDGITRPLIWTLDKNIITCTIEKGSGNIILKFEYIENNPDQGNVDTLKFLDGSYKNKFLTPAKSGTNHEDIFVLPETTTKDHTLEPESINIDDLLQMSYKEYSDKDYYFYIIVNEISPYMVKAEVYGNSDFSGTYFKDIQIPLGEIRNDFASASVGSKYRISAQIIYCSKESLSLSAFDAVPLG